MNVQTIREFRLSPPGSHNGISCDAGGVFVGPVALLKRTRVKGAENWAPRGSKELSEAIGAQFGLPIDVASKSAGLAAIAKALNADDIARAQLVTLHLNFPQPPPLAKNASSRNEQIRFIRELYWSDWIKWDEDAHPRWPAGSADSKGGKFAPNGEGAKTGTADRSARIRLADAAMSDASNDPVAEAATRAAARRNSGVVRPRAKPADESSLQTLDSRISSEARSVLSEIGQAEIAESNANLAAGNAERHAVAGWLRDLANYSAKPWIGLDGQPEQISIINTGDPNSDQGAVIAHIILEPNAPLARPGTNADWIDSLIALASAGSFAAHPAFRPDRAGATVAADSTQPAINKPFITLRAKLSPDFDTSQPIGRFEARDDLNDLDFGNYAHNEIGALLQEEAGARIQLELNVAPNARGVDIMVPEDFVDDIGFEYGEIKPLSRTGRSRFNNQVLNIWNLEGRVQPITYDRNGNIYYGFPGYDKP